MRHARSDLYSISCLSSPFPQPAAYEYRALAELSGLVGTSLAGPLTHELTPHIPAGEFVNVMGRIIDHKTPTITKVQGIVAS